MDATADGIVIRANSVAEKGVYGIQVVTSDAKTFKFVVYYGGAASTFTSVWFGAGKGDVIYWYNDLHTLNGKLAISSSVTCIDEANGIYRFSVTFTPPLQRRFPRWKLRVG